MVIAANVTTICCIYKEKIVKNDSYRRNSYDSDRKKIKYYNL